jgi:CO/xanthine dehydrogenase Mo-binding subunit
MFGKVGTIPCSAATPGVKLPVQHVLAVGKLGFVGQPVAVVVAESLATAHDAVDLIKMDVEVLPAVVDPEQAAQPGAPRVHDDFDDNVMFHIDGPAHVPSLTPLELTEALFQQADKIVSLKITQQRLVPMTIAGRKPWPRWPLSPPTSTGSSRGASLPASNPDWRPPATSNPPMARFRLGHTSVWSRSIGRPAQWS